MKKFFSMFCALMVMLSVSAAPQRVTFNPGKAGAQKEMVAKQKVQLEVMPTAKQTVPGNAIKRAPFAKKETFDVVIVKCEGTNWGTDVQYVMDDADGMYRFAFDIYLPTGQEDVTLGQTYTLADMDPEYTWGGCPATQEPFADFTAATFVKTVDGATGLVNVTASATDADGNVYNIVYQETPFVPTGDTVEVVITEPMTYKYYSSDGDWYLKGANNDYSVTLDLVNNDSVSPAGTYDAESVLASYTSVTVKATSTKLDMVDIEAVVTDANNRYDVEAYMLCSDGNVYHITMFYAIPEAQYFDTIVATNLEIEPYTLWGFILGYTATASNDGYQVALSFDADTTGVYEASGTITPLNGSATKIYSGNINLVNTNGDYTITGSVLCNNNTEYTLDLSFVMPTKTRDVVFLGTDDMFNDYTATDGLWQMIGYNQDSTQYMSITVYAEAINGNYTRADMYKAYCAAYDLVDDSIIAEYKFMDLDISVQEDTLGVILAGTVLAQNIDNVNDVPEFTVLMNYIRPQASREETVVIAAEVTDLTADYGVWQIRGYNATNDLYVSIAAYADELAGAYTTSMLYQDYTVAVAFVGGDTVYYNAVEADFTVAVDANNNVVLSGDVLFQNENDRADVPLFHLTMNGVINTGLEYDEQDADFSENFPVYELDYEYLMSYGAIFVDAINNNDARLNLLMFVEAGSEGLADGTYTFSDSQQPGTVWACSGITSEGYIDYSFAGYLDAEGYITNVWFMVGGTVTVNAGVITVHAVNSYDRTVDAVLQAPTAIEEVETMQENNAQKFMRNGNLIIRHNGVEYNAQGAAL